MEIFNFSELTDKLDQAKSITKEAVQVSQTIFLENNLKVENGDKWFDNVSSFLLFTNWIFRNLYFCAYMIIIKIVEPLVQILDLFSSSINNFKQFLEFQENRNIHVGMKY